MNRLTLAAAAASMLTLGVSVSASAETAQTHPAQLVFRWLECSQQQPNGQIGIGGNPIARSSEVAISLAAAGQDAASFRHGDTSLAAYLETVTPVDVSKTDTPVGTNGELLLARALQPSAGPTAAPIAQLQLAKQLTGDNKGEFGTDLFSDALAILGLRAAHQPVGGDAITFLESKQSAPNHGWSFDNAGQFGSDSNTTALVLQALLAAGVAASDTHISNGFQFIESQFENGGFTSQADPTKPAGDLSNTPDANSDELAIQAIVAAALEANETWGQRLHAAETDLVGRQISSGPDAGALSGFSKLFATTEAPTAFLLRSLTVSSKAAAQLPLLTCPQTAPAPHPSAPPHLAQTGGVSFAPALWLAGLAMFVAGLSLWRRRRSV